ncbi:MAG: phosphoribulokinase [Proteobacteria bacterium]|nr:phosphoribulokinase [Pseudomonadota bacterium]
MTIPNEMMTAFLDKHRLPASFVRTATEFYEPLCLWVEQRLADRQGSVPFVLGINGAQGTGKSTLADFILEVLAFEHDRITVVLSMDDLYLTRVQRQALAQDVHPLLGTRGVPGTHDIELGLAVIESLKTFKQGQSLLVPRFDKSTDDRFAESEWTQVSDPVDLVIFEGWCVGSESVPDDELLIPINDLETSEDPSGFWRRYVNHQLQDVYAPLFERLDALVFMSAPDFDCVLRWRTEQEEKLAASTSAREARVMTKSQIERFIQHYERITRQNLKSLATSADVRLELGQDHQVVSAHYKE